MQVIMISFSVIALLCLKLSGAPPASPMTHTSEERDNALRWASEHRASIFDELFPAASDDVAMPTCRMTTIRSSGSLDTFEFMIRIIEDCPAVQPTTGKIAKPEVRGELLIPEESPLDDQLATLRLSDPTITPEMASTRIKLRTVLIPPRQTQRLLKGLDAVSASPLPPVEIALDARMYEVRSSTGLQTRFVMFAERSSSRRDRELTRLIDATLAALGNSRDKLLYDPAAWTSNRATFASHLLGDGRAEAAEAWSLAHYEEITAIAFPSATSFDDLLMSGEAQWVVIIRCRPAYDKPEFQISLVRHYDHTVQASIFEVLSSSVLQQIQTIRREKVSATAKEVARLLSTRQRAIDGRHNAALMRLARRFESLAMRVQRPTGMALDSTSYQLWSRTASQEIFAAIGVASSGETNDPVVKWVKALTQAARISSDADTDRR